MAGEGSDVGPGPSSWPDPNALPMPLVRPTSLLAFSGAKRLGTGIQQAWLDQNPYHMIEGESFGFVVTYKGVTTVASPSNVLYLDGTDVSSTSLTGTASASCNTVATKVLQSLLGPNRYLLTTTATCDTSHTYVKKLMIIVHDPSEEEGGRSWVGNGPQWMVEGESMVYTITLHGAHSISNTPTAKCYKDGTDVTSTNLSGVCTYSGLAVTLPALTAVTAGRYVVALTVIVDSSSASAGRTEIHKLLVYAQNAEDEI